MGIYIIRTAQLIIDENQKCLRDKIDQIGAYKVDFILCANFRWLVAIRSSNATFRHFTAVPMLCFALPFTQGIPLPISDFLD